LAVGLTGVVLRLSLWWFSIRSNDTVLGSFHSRHILAGGPRYNCRKFSGIQLSSAHGLYAAHVWSWTNGDLYVIVSAIVSVPPVARFRGRVSK
jgi:hypothetical protein